jgi:WD40 repeat protein
LAVTASADHSLRVWDLSKGSHVRHLFNKNFGHKEWVTCCCFLQDQRILSGGMDGELCLWDRRAVRCDNLSSHSGSISSVMADNADIAVSASYDKSLIIWDLHRLKPLDQLQCSAPVTTFTWNNSLIVSGERTGKVAFWDINTGKNFYTMACHTDAIHKLSFSIDGGNYNLLASCGKDGKVAVCDLRDNNCVFSKQIHRGAVNFIGGTLSNTLVSASADMKIMVLDMMMGFENRISMQANSGILCGEIVDNLFVSGCIDGNLIVFNMDTGDACWGFGVDNGGGVNCFGVSPNRKKIITGGESGIPLLLNF